MTVHAPLRIEVTCSDCGLLGDGLSSDPPQGRRPPNWKGVDGSWGRWDELDRVAAAHSERPPRHATRVSARPA